MRPDRQARLERWITGAESRKLALQEVIALLERLHHTNAAKRVQKLLKRTQQHQADLLRQVAPQVPTRWATPQIFLPTGPGEAIAPRQQAA